MESVCSCPVSLYPWAKNSIYEHSVVGLNQQILDFISWISPTCEERKMRDDVSQRIKEIVSELWSTAKVEIVGSTRTNLFLPTSDIDIAIFGVHSVNYNDPNGTPQPLGTPSIVECLYKLARNLEKIAYKDSVQVFNTAKVPIVKFRDAKSGIEVDISFGIRSGIENAEVVLEYLNLFPAVRPLTLVTKYFLKQKFLNNSWSGGIGSYTLIILIISYLQLHTTAEERESPDDNILRFLLGFFRLYGLEFDYSNSVISILNGGAYLSKTDKKWKLDKHPDFLAVEDPHNLENDLGRSTFKINAVKEWFYLAFHLLNIESHPIPNKDVTSTPQPPIQPQPQAESQAEPQPESQPNSPSAIGYRADLKLSYMIWVNTNIQFWRKKIKDIYGPEEVLSTPTCPVHKNSPYDQIIISDDYFYYDPVRYSAFVSLNTQDLAQSGARLPHISHNNTNSRNIVNSNAPHRVINNNTNSAQPGDASGSHQSDAANSRSHNYSSPHQKFHPPPKNFPPHNAGHHAHSNRNSNNNKLPNSNAKNHAPHPKISSSAPEPTSGADSAKSKQQQPRASTNAPSPALSRSAESSSDSNKSTANNRGSGNAPHGHSNSHVKNNTNSNRSAHSNNNNGPSSSGQNKNGRNSGKEKGGSKRHDREKSGGRQDRERKAKPAPEQPVPKPEVTHKLVASDFPMLGSVMLPKPCESLTAPNAMPSTPSPEPSPDTKRSSDGVDSTTPGLDVL